MPLDYNMKLNESNAICIIIFLVKLSISNIQENAFIVCRIIDESCKLVVQHNGIALLQQISIFRWSISSLTFKNSTEIMDAVELEFVRNLFDTHICIAQ